MGFLTRKFNTPKINNNKPKVMIMISNEILELCIFLKIWFKSPK